jgi:uncharacterized protein
MQDRVIATPAAVALLRKLQAEHGRLLLHQSGGCCDGSSPICLRQADFRVSPGDVLLGEVAGCPVYIGAAQFPAWSRSALTIDVMPFAQDSFSLEAPDGVRLVTRTQVLSEAAAAAGWQA